MRTRIVAAALMMTAAWALPAAAVEEDPPTLTDDCGQALTDYRPPADPTTVDVPEPVVESLDICASWYRPVVTQDEGLVAVEFSTKVHGDLSERPAGTYFAWDWFSEDRSCYHQAVVTESATGELEALLRDQCSGSAPTPLVDFLVWYTTPPLLSLPTDGASIDGDVVTLRIELADASERVRQILAPGRVLTDPHSHTGLQYQRDRFALTDHDTAYREGADVPLA